MANSKVFPKHAWVNCRETDPDLLCLGEVLTEEADIWQKAHSTKSNKVIGKMSHGMMVSVLDKELSGEHNTAYFKISSDNLSGWISESFLAWQWSSFTFIGNLKPEEACKDLYLNLEYLGANLIIKNNGFAAITEGDPNHLEIISKAIYRLVTRITNAQAPLTQISLHAEFSNWVEVPIGENEKRQVSIGFPLLENKGGKTIPNSSIEDAHSIIMLMEIYPYLDLALSDFHQALEYPQHALIFLSRAIESIENHFWSMTKNKNGNGKEKIMRDFLGIKRSDVEYITQRANVSHRRHASRDANVEILSTDELAECFYKTANILSAFATYITPEAVNILKSRS